MRLTEFADPEVYSLAARNVTDILTAIEEMFPDGLPDDVHPVVLCLTKPVQKGLHKRIGIRYRS
jgi:hypothetical protein